MKRRLFISACALLALAMAFVTPARQADAAYPDRPITLIMPFGTGNAPDTTARIIAEYFQSKHGITMLIVSKPGGSGIPGLIDLLKAKPDGYTLCLTSANALTVVPQVKPCGKGRHVVRPGRLVKLSVIQLLRLPPRRNDAVHQVPVVG